MVIGRKFLLRGEEYIAVATNGENRGRLSRRRRGPFGGSTPKISMITRKRGRIGENGRNGARSPATAAFREPAETTESQQASVCQQFSSESEDASGLDLEDFLGLDGLNWTLDDDALSPLLDITGATTTNADGDDQAEIGASPSRIEELSAPLKIRGPAQKTQKLEESFPGRINKNAIAARMNRLKKKEYVNGLEKKVGTLVTENCSLRQENSKLNKRVEELEDETRSPTRMTTTMPYLERG